MVAIRKRCCINTGNTSPARWALQDLQNVANEENSLFELERLISNSIDLQMESDVPLGAFLSGGIDSSLIASLMQDRAQGNVNTFSIGFDDQRFNEAPFAKRVAEHIGSNHIELYLNGRDALDVVPQIATIYDEPFSDLSQIPTFLLSKLARQSVTVALTGDGGDEIFCGYNRYTLAARAWNTIEKVPYWVRQYLSKVILLMPHRVGSQIDNLLAALNRETLTHYQLMSKLNKAAVAINARTISEQVSF